MWRQNGGSLVDDGDRLTPSLTRGQQHELKQLIDSTPMLNYLWLVPEAEAEKAMGTMTQVEWKCDMIVHYARRTRHALHVAPRAGGVD